MRLFRFMTSFSLAWYAIAGAEKGVDVGLPVLATVLLAVIGPTAGRWYADVTSGVTPKQFIRGEWFVGVALLTGVVWVVLYWAIVQEAGASILWPTVIAFAFGFVVRMAALYRSWEEPLAKEPAGVYKHDDGRPLLGRKIARRSKRELRDLGLTVESDAGQAPTAAPQTTKG